jgi:hypothetical protein
VPVRVHIRLLFPLLRRVSRCVLRGLGRLLGRFRSWYRTVFPNRQVLNFNVEAERVSGSWRRACLHDRGQELKTDLDARYLPSSLTLITIHNHVHREQVVDHRY